VTLTVVAAVGATAAAVHRAGAISVELRPEHGDACSVRLPAALANLAIMLVPAAPLREATAELGPVWPAVSSGFDELLRAPDFVLLEVRERDQFVSVRKVGRQLLVSIDTDEQRLQIELPLTTVRRMLRKLDS
jgi:hypothetical protein